MRETNVPIDLNWRLIRAIQVDVPAALTSSRFHEDELSVLFGRDDKLGFVDRGDTVADCNSLPVDADGSLGRHKIGVPKIVRSMREGRACEQRRTQYARVGTDRQRIVAPLRIEDRWCRPGDPCDQTCTQLRVLSSRYGLELRTPWLCSRRPISAMLLSPFFSASAFVCTE